MLTEAQYKRFGIHDQFIDLVADQMMLKEIFSSPSVVARKRSDPRVAQIIQRMIRRLDRLEDSVTAMEAMLPPPEEDDVEEDDVEDDGGEDGDPAAGQEQRRAAPETPPPPEAGKSIVLCPNCSRKLKVESDRIGKPIRCPVCKHIFTRTEPDVSRPDRGNPPPRLTLPKKGSGARRQVEENPPTYLDEASPEYDEGLALLCRIGYVCCLIFSILFGLLTLLEIGLIVIISNSSENGESASSDGLWPIIIAIILSPIMAAGFGMAASWLKKKSRTDRKLQLNRIQLNWGKGLAAVVSFALVFTIAPVKEHFFECAMAGLIFIPIAYALIKFFTNLYRATMQ